MSARHAATDGSFGRSAGGAAARGALLLAVALVLGIILLRSGGGDPYSRSLRASASPGSPEVTVQPPTATTVTVPLRSPADIKVLPTNGTSTAGAAANAGNRLKSAGYNVLAASNTTAPATASNVFYNPGFEREARVVAQLLGFPDATVQPMPTPPPVADTRGADVIVVVGPDQAPKAGATPATSPPTTARRSTATTAKPTVTTAHTATTTRAATTTTAKR
jgi:hypothetical protein